MECLILRAWINGDERLRSDSYSVSRSSAAPKLATSVRDLRHRFRDLRSEVGWLLYPLPLDGRQGVILLKL